MIVRFMTKLSLVAILFVAACGGSQRAPELPRGAVAVSAEGEHRACSCVLLHLTTSASPTRAVDHARLVELSAEDPTMCAYEVLADDHGAELDRSSDLRPFLVLSQSGSVDLAMKPGETELHVVEHVEDACGPGVTSGGKGST